MEIEGKDHQRPQKNTKFTEDNGKRAGKNPGHTMFFCSLVLQTFKNFAFFHGRFGKRDARLILDKTQFLYMTFCTLEFPSTPRWTIKSKIIYIKFCSMTLALC